jgi:ribose-phosphate pyrophosphokinase
MQVLNLTDGFEPYGQGSLRNTTHHFSGGEVQIRLEESNLRGESILVTTRIKSSDDLMRLLLVTDALREKGVQEIHIFIPYLPYARQDRVVRAGEAFSLRVFADILNAQGYASVTVFDVHSDVAPALIRRCVVVPNHGFVRKVLEGVHDYWLLSPDAGAFKKITLLADALLYSEEIAVCTKVRVHGGAINSVTVSVPDFYGKDVFIIDDICDGGRTFIALAKEIRSRNSGRINLIVSHGIFSYGEEVIRDGGIDHIYTTDSFKKVESTLITQVQLCDILTPITTRA